MQRARRYRHVVVLKAERRTHLRRYFVVQVQLAAERVRVHKCVPVSPMAESQTPE